MLHYVTKWYVYVRIVLTFLKRYSDNSMEYLKSRRNVPSGVSFKRKT